MTKKIVTLALILSISTLYAKGNDGSSNPSESNQVHASQSSITINNMTNTNECIGGNCNDMTLSQNNVVVMTVIGQGVAPSSTISPAQASALAKRAAIADAYRQMAEKVNGVRVEGRDFIRNMVAQRSEVRTCVQALIKNASVVESRFNDGLFEVEMELRVAGNQWYDRLAN